MNESKIIKLQSITYATKARNLLLKFGISSEIMKSPKLSGESTCGYSLVVPNKGDYAVKILESKGFKILSVEDSEPFDLS